MRRHLILIALCGLCFSGCGSSPYHDASQVEESVEMEMATPTSGVENIEVVEMPEQQKIIKTGQMGIRVERIEQTKARVDSLVARYRGYYAEENFSDGYRSGLVMTIRVPFGLFDAFVAGLEAGRGEILYKSISARDVSEEYLDVETRLANKRNYLERYREILRRANTIKEIMEVEQYIRRLEEEIESAQGRLRYLDSQTAYSTLELTLSTEQVSVPDRNSFWTRTRQALSTGWDGIVTFLVGLLYLWPLLLVAAALWIWICRRKKRRKKS